MELWFTEKHTPDTGLSVKITDCLFQGETKYQHIAILQSPQYGKILLLDGLVMLTEKEEFVYHEMITHVPLLSHPKPRKVLVIGGGDGGTVREILKHEAIEEVDLVEIDQVVVEKCREFFPGLANSLDSPRVSVRIEDGIKFVQDHDPHYYDVVIVDSTDPIGPATVLFTESFYQGIARILKEDGIMVAQGESPYFHKKVIIPMHQLLAKVFPVSRMYLAFIPTYPSGCWSFAWCSKKYTPCEHLNRQGYEKLQPVPGYYNPELHQAAFVLPNFVKDMLADGSNL